MTKNNYEYRLIYLNVPVDFEKCSAKIFIYYSITRRPLSCNVCLLVWGRLEKWQYHIYTFRSGQNGDRCCRFALDALRAFNFNGTTEMANFMKIKMFTQFIE